MQPQKPKSSKLRIFSWLTVLTLATVAFWQRQNILDWNALRNYDPPVAVVKLATETTMTSAARRIFYVQKPAIQDKDAFYTSCEEGETTVVLGCYKPNNGIYLLKVSDERLAGIEQVTAAHEMLHAVYERLGVRERQHIDTLLNQAYASITNENITEKIDLYKKNGADVTNELHSILGTEARDLSPELETHYAKYFSKRDTIVSFAEHYWDVFASRKKQVADYDAQLGSIEQQVTANNQILTEQKAAINAESARLDVLLNSGQIDSYNSGVEAYNRSLVPFRTLLAQTQQLVDQYKTILEQRNQIALEAQELGKALDSRKIQTTVTDQ